MAEALYFFRFNPEVIRHHLLPLLRNESVIHATEVNDIESLDRDQLWTLFNWFREHVESAHGSTSDLEDKIQQTMLGFGIELFFEIPTKTPVRKFHDILWDYESHSGKDFAYRMDVPDFLKALDYMLCYTGEVMLFLNRHYYKRNTDDETAEITEVISAIDATPHRDVHALAQTPCSAYLASFHDALPRIQRLVAYRQARGHQSYSIPDDLREADEQESDAVNTGTLFYTVLALKKKLTGQDGTICKLHSF